MKIQKVISGITAVLVLAGAVPVFSVNPVQDYAVTASAVETYKNLKYEKYSDHIEITDCDTSATSVVIPAEIDGLPVTSIGDGAFSDYFSRLTSITIPDGVTSIGNGAFQDCSSLTEITIPDSVTSIGYDAFGYCSSLESITILNPDCEIYNSFYTINNGYDDEYNYYFNGTIRGYSGSTAEEYAKEYGYNFESIDEAPKADKNLKYEKYSDHIEITDCNESATSVVIPAEIDGLPVTSIGYKAFFGCFSLTSITIPDSVTSIGNGAFAGTPWLEAKKKENPLVVINNILIDGSTCEGDVVIPDSVTSVGNGAFSGCDATSITIPDSVTSIGYLAFAYCYGLTSITIPDSVTNIESRAFYECSSLESITISDSVTSIGVEVFAYCDALESITIPDSVTSIDGYAFERCKSLTSITILNPVCEISDDSGTISNGYDDYSNEYYFNGTIRGYSGSTAQAYAKEYGYNFESIDEAPKADKNLEYEKYSDHIEITGGDESAEKVIIPAEIEGLPVTSIGDWAFGGCSCLTSIKIPNSVTNIGYGAFGYCSSLESITIPDSVTSVDGSAFSDCSSLTSITIPDSVTSIGYHAFSGTPWLEAKQKENPLVVVNNILIDGTTCEGDVVIPDSVTNIGYGAFRKCSSLTSITILNPVCEIYDSSETICNEADEYWNGYFNGTIRGYSGSTAEEYAEKYGYNFESIGEAPEYKTGDVNGDGKIDATDASAILVEYALASTEQPSGFSESQKKAGDIDGDGKIDSTDASRVLEYYSYLSTGGTIRDMNKWLEI